MINPTLSVLCLSLVCAFLPAQEKPKQAGPKSPQQRIGGPLPIPKAVILHRGDHRVIIDGSLQDWPGLPPILMDDIRLLSGTAPGAYRGDADASARIFLMWDEEDIYFAAVVRDDWHIRMTKKSELRSEIPPADSFLLTFDPRRDTRAVGEDSGRREDAEFWLADVEDQGRKVVVWDRYRGTARFAQGAAVTVQRDKDRGLTVFEARIPWTEILPHGKKAHDRMVFDMQMVFSDYDEPTDPMPQTRVGWNFGMGPMVKPGLYGTVWLTKAKAGSVQKIEFPERPASPDPQDLPVLGRKYWVDINRNLNKTRPAIVNKDTVDPSLAGGEDRKEILTELDYRLEKFPRLDFLGFQQRIHRRMTREAAGIAASGLPYFWDGILDSVQHAAEKDAPERGFRVFRLPQGGWLVRSRTASFAINPGGFAIEKKLWGAIDFVLLTEPNNVTKRNDQLLMRMSAAKPKRPVFAHVSVHLPGLSIKDTPLVKPGLEYTKNGLKVSVLGTIDKQGYVSVAVGYHVLWPDGSSLVVSGVSMLEEHVETKGKIDLLLLSARHPRARVVGQRLAAGLTILDDVLECSALQVSPRVSIVQAYELQRGLRPRSSMILAPGESCNISPSK